MSDPSPQRPRRAQPPPPPRGGSTSLPWVALVIGVIVAGLGIGALISAYQNRGTPPPQLGAGVPAVTPVPQATAAPSESPLAAPSATPSPTPEPTDSPTPRPSPAASPSPSPSPTAAATASALPSASPSPAPTPSPTAAPTPKPTPAPTVRPTVAPTVRPTATPAPPVATVAPVPSPRANDATAVVRRYLNAVIAGDTTTAADMLAAGGTVKEAAVLDPSARIASIRVTRSDASGAFVEADVTTARGSYVATFHVTTATTGGTIDQHDYIKV